MTEEQRSHATQIGDFATKGKPIGVLESLPSFALLGPGFGGEPFLLLSGLEQRPWPTEPYLQPLLCFAGFETAGHDAACFAAESSQQVTAVLEPPAGSPQPRLQADGYARAVEVIREAIAAGDVYQVCLTARAELDPLPGSSLLASACHAGLPPFAAWVRFPDGTELVSASPELLLSLDDDRLLSQPMKGTAASAEAEQLAASGKDWSELAMITDLVRNDLTRIARPRSVRVRSPRRFLELPYAVQTVSEVEGQLAPGLTVRDALQALHPGGSVTGAPKQAALEMIRRLEPGPRGAYCGALGLSRGSRTVISLLIRTASRPGPTAPWTLGVGCGIVYESEPERELEELRIKLRALTGP